MGIWNSKSETAKLSYEKEITKILIQELRHSDHVEQLTRKMREKITSEVKEIVKRELLREIKENLKKYIEDEVKNELQQAINDEEFKKEFAHEIVRELLLENTVVNDELKQEAVLLLKEGKNLSCETYIDTEPIVKKKQREEN